MSVIVFEALVIILLVIINGLFAMSELAVMSARKAKLQHLAKQGDRRARAALELANNPGRFLSTIQIGITLIGILAGAFGGATIAAQIGAQIGRIPALAFYAEALGLAVVVVIITFFSLIIGELTPKQIALGNAERIASLVADPMRALSILASPAVRFLEICTDGILKALRIRPSSDPPVTEEEITVLIEQGTRAGIFKEAEKDMVESVFRLGDRRVSALMTPRLDIVWLNVNAPLQEIQRQIMDTPYSRFPLCQDTLDHIIGIVRAKDLLACPLSDDAPDMKTLAKQPLMVPETRSALQVLELFRNSTIDMAMVINEYGSMEGLITTNDILKAIVGYVAVEAQPAEPYAIQREDGPWLMDGLLTLDEFRKIFPMNKLPQEEKGHYHTLAGFIMTHLGRVPAPADYFEWGGLRFEVVDMDGRRIDRVMVSPASPSTD